MRTTLHSLLILLTLLPGCQPPSAALAEESKDGWDLARTLLGDWVDSTSSDTFTVVEAWTQVDDSTLSGAGRVLAGADTVFIEGLKLMRRGGTLVYSALPGGQNNGEWTDFNAVPAGGDTLHFTNLAHDFPQHIRYFREGSGWHAVVSGLAKGTPQEDHYRFASR
ncbi:MAG: hypothetical protein IPM68_07145 [Flavobacteriales bacterium]|nr:hypothetical protein [Flavobacteriales bacterium]